MKNSIDCESVQTCPQLHRELARNNLDVSKDVLAGIDTVLALVDDHLVQSALIDPKPQVDEYQLGNLVLLARRAATLVGDDIETLNAEFSKQHRGVH